MPARRLWRGLLVLLVVLAGCDGDPAGGSRDADLIEAARRGDATEVGRLLSQGASVTARDPEGATALVAAAYGNHLEAARALVEAGADVNAKDRTEQSAFLLATSENYLELLDLTLAAGADVAAKDSYNGTGLIRAAERGHAEVVRRLLATPIEVDHVNRLGWTALLEAVILGDGGPDHLRTVRLLVEAGADLDLPDRDGVTALAHAERRGQEQVAAVLRESGDGR
jgi:ankyrin repeat protein